MARKTLTASKQAAATIVNPTPWRFPKRADFHFDFPRGVQFGLPALSLPAFEIPKLGNSRGVAKSWTNAATRIARTTKNGVSVTFDGSTQTFRSVAEAFRTLRLEFSRHIRFRGVLKASKREAYATADGRVYMFEIIENDTGEAFRIEG
jgi:hypothetical protein